MLEAEVARTLEVPAAMEAEVTEALTRVDDTVEDVTTAEETTEDAVLRAEETEEEPLDVARMRVELLIDAMLAAGEEEDAADVMLDVDAALILLMRLLLPLVDADVVSETALFELSLCFETLTPTMMAMMATTKRSRMPIMTVFLRFLFLRSLSSTSIFRYSSTSSVQIFSFEWKDSTWEGCGEAGGEEW
jgi:hypothetical protein